MRACWCGNTQLAPFSAQYAQCTACTTLVSLQSLTDEQLTVQDDDTDFYGKQYWLDHQEQGLGIPAIQSRARIDLAERNLHWLNTLLRYRLPPAQVLELVCAHGSFVALMRQAGYDASGLELSPWVVDYGRTTFDIPVSVGPIEALPIAPQSLDVIILMDVLEHLPDPLHTLGNSLQLLKPDGVLLIQTPQYKPDLSFDTMVQTQDRFLEMLLADEHIYLFSQRAAQQLFTRLGAHHIAFEQALFSHYDMFFVVSRCPIQPLDPDTAHQRLQTIPSARMALALLDVRQREQDRARELAASEADRTQRAHQIDALNTIVADLQAQMQQVQADRARDIDKLTTLLHESDADRAARATQITTLHAMLAESEADRAARAVQIDTLTGMVQAKAQEIALQAQDVEYLRSHLHTLLSRRPVGLMRKLAAWPEAVVLADKLGIPRD